MKRLILTITIALVLIGIDTDVANAQINWQYIAQSETIRHTSCGRFPRIGGSIGDYIGGYIGGSRINWQYVAQSEMMRHTGGYGGYGYPGTNVRVKYNERWGLQGGQRSYEQFPDYLGKIIDLGVLAILSR